MKKYKTIYMQCEWNVGVRLYETFKKIEDHFSNKYSSICAYFLTFGIEGLKW